MTLEKRKRDVVQLKSNAEKVVYVYTRINLKGNLRIYFMLAQDNRGEYS